MHLASLERAANEIAAHLSYALDAEAVTWPKPGLVTATSTGCHDDMDVFTFLRSASHLQQTFHDAALVAASKKSPTTLMSALRVIGLHGEHQMNAATGGINTHRGAIFFGVLLAAATMRTLYLSDTIQEISPNSICDMAREIAEHTLLTDLCLTEKSSSKDLTTGLRVNRQFGITGARGEVLTGFPSVLAYGLPALRAARQKGANRRSAQAHALVALLAVTQDSTVLNRNSDPLRLTLVHHLGKEILSAGSVFTATGRRLIEKADTLFSERSISPGGSADLLAICIYLDELKQKLICIPDQRSGDRHGISHRF